MLASQAALREFTGSLEMSVFQTLLAGNIGQLGAPGTVVPVAAFAAGADVAAGREVVAAARAGSAWPAAAVTCAAGAAQAAAVRPQASAVVIVSIAARRRRAGRLRRAG
jgi:hypothetical protein